MPKDLLLYSHFGGSFFREHRAKRKAAHTRIGKGLIGEWKPMRMSNGETKSQVYRLATLYS